MSNNIIYPVDKLNTFLTQFRCITKEDRGTHTRMRGGKWTIPDENLEEFYSLYADLVNSLNNPELSISEKDKIKYNLNYTEHPRQLSPVKIDLDFRYLAKSPERRYSQEMLEDFVSRLITLINPWYLLSEEESYCFITEKPKPSIDTRKKVTINNENSQNNESSEVTIDLDDNNNLKLIKDGVHLMFPYLIIPNEMQLLFREEMLKISSDVFSEMNLMTAEGKPQPISEVIDLSVIDRNNWMLYGSRKAGGDAYQLTRIINVDVDNHEDTVETTINDIDITNYSEDERIRLLSMRSEYVDKYIPGETEPQTRIPGQIRNEKQAALDKNIKAYKITAGKSFAPKGKHKKCKPKVLKENELKIVKMLVDALSSSRADTYKSWLEVGWACHNIDERLLNAWIDFSKKSPTYSHVAEADCRKFWDEMYDEGLGIGSLRYWVKEDNLHAYYDILREESIDAIMKSIENTFETGESKLDNALREMKIQPYDVANVLHSMCKHEYICVSEKNGKYGMYYHFENHRWQESAGSILLRNIVSEEIPKTYKKTIQQIVSDSTSNPEAKEVMDDWISQLGQFKSQMQTIRSTNFKNNVMQEAIELFYDKENKAKNRFVNKLDDRPSMHLIGFDNGVFDLAKSEFRPGRPEDYISMSTNINYNEYSWEDQDVVNIMEFVSQVLPDEDERDYVLVLLASFMNGNNRNEKFHIWTGSGGNGKSKLIELYERAIGDYGCHLPVSILTNKRKGGGEATPEMARIKGRRFAVLQEPDEHTRLNVGLMKEMTGGDTICARALYKEPIEFKPQIKMILTCNHLPELPYDDEATWRRVRSVEFKSRFVEAAEVDKNNKYSHPKDVELSEKFEDWSEPFMWILIQYYKIWCSEGLKEPASVISFTKEYQAQNDQFRDFYEDTIEKNPSAVDPITIAQVWAKYGEWHSINESGQKKNKKDLKKYLEKKLGQHHMAADSKAQGWVGYRLKHYDTSDNDSVGSFLLADIDEIN